VQPGRGTAPRVHTLADLLHRLCRLVHLKHLPIKIGVANDFDCGLIEMESCGAIHPAPADMHHSLSVVGTDACAAMYLNTRRGGGTPLGLRNGCRPGELLLPLFALLAAAPAKVWHGCGWRVQHCKGGCCGCPHLNSITANAIS
jgi:hypothetical protein